MLRFSNHPLIIMKSTLTAVLVALALSASSFSLAQNENKQLAYSPPTIEEDSARITISTQQSQFKNGANVVLDIVLTNVGTKPFVTSKRTSPEHYYDIRILGPHKEEVPHLPPLLKLRASGGPEIELWHDESIKGHVWLNNIFDLREVGRYQVIVSKKFSRNKTLVTVSSDPLEFEITTGAPISDWQ